MEAATPFTAENVALVFFAALLTALATGLGVLPLRLRTFARPDVVALGGAAAAGLMLGASWALTVEAVDHDVLLTVVGALVGAAFVQVASSTLHRRDDLSVGALVGADARRALLVVGVMTAHSFAEGVGVGVSFGGGEALGVFITTAIAIHNIPEGLAIGLVLVPRGVGLLRAAGWSVFSSLPQPLVAVPAFAVVALAAVWLPFGLGLAAGAMVWLCVVDLLPEAVADSTRGRVAATTAAAAAAMLLIQTFIPT